MDGLEAYCQRLAEEPILARPYRRPPYHWSRYVSHVVYFRREDDGNVVVVRILAKKMLPELDLDPARDDPDEDDA
jgi:plasmid stabilization system protein ParE